MDVDASKRHAEEGPQLTNRKSVDVGHRPAVNHLGGSLGIQTTRDLSGSRIELPDIHQENLTTLWEKFRQSRTLPPFGLGVVSCDGGDSQSLGCYPGVISYSCATMRGGPIWLLDCDCIIAHQHKRLYSAILQVDRRVVAITIDSEACSRVKPGTHDLKLHAAAIAAHSGRLLSVVSRWPLDV